MIICDWETVGVSDGDSMFLLEFGYVNQPKNQSKQHNPKSTPYSWANVASSLPNPSKDQSILSFTRPSPPLSYPPIIN